MQYVDTRKNTDCHYFLIGTCVKGNSCPFLHDPAKITLTRAQQGQQDCTFFLEGRCKKGSLCPYKHDQAKLEALRLLYGGAVPPGAVRPGMPFGMPAAASTPAAVQQPITVDFGGDAGPALQPLTAPHVSAPPAVRPAMAFPGTVRSQLVPAGAAAPAAGVASRSQQQPTVSAAAAQPGLRVGQQEQQQRAPSGQQEQQQRAPSRQQEHQQWAPSRQREQQQASEVQKQPQKRRQPDPLEASAVPFIPSRLAGRLALPSGSPTRTASDGERHSPKRLRVGRQSAAAAPRVVVDEDEGAGRPHVRRGGGVRGLVASAIHSALGGPEQAVEPKLRRTIVLGDELRPGKRRMSGTEEQSVKFAVDEVPALASSSPPKAGKRQPQAEQGAGRAPGSGAAQQGQRRVGSPTAPAAAAAAPRQAERAPEVARKQEQGVFQPPRSLQELRQVRRQQSNGSQGNVHAATSQAGQARPRRHRPIVWQPETGETAEQAPASKQAEAAEARPAARPAPATSPPAATPAARAPAAAAPAPAAGAGKPLVERSATTLPVAQQPPAAATVVSKPAEVAPLEDERVAAAAAQNERPLTEDADLDLGDDEFDYGGEEGDGGDEMDDFEAQMRALQEQL